MVSRLRHVAGLLDSRLHYAATTYRDKAGLNARVPVSRNDSHTAGGDTRNKTPASVGRHPACGPAVDTRARPPPVATSPTNEPYSSGDFDQLAAPGPWTAWNQRPGASVRSAKSCFFDVSTRNRAGRLWRAMVSPAPSCSRSGGQNICRYRLCRASLFRR